MYQYKYKKRKSLKQSPTKSPLSIVTVSHKKAKHKQSPGKNQVEANSAIIERAEKFRLSLGPEFPSFVKTLSQSHVSGGCTMNLPARFSRLYLVGDDRTIAFVDEFGREFRASYNVKRIEVGWKRFSHANKLCMGDVAVFQLIGSFKFKVYIVRGNDMSGTDDQNDLALDAYINKSEYASDSSVGSLQSENAGEDSYNTDSEDSDNSDTKDSDTWEMVISGYPKKLEREKQKKSQFLPGSDVIERAQKIKDSLSDAFPSCIKPYSQLCHHRESLRLPEKFCRNFLKDDDGTVKDVTLVSEDDGKEYEMKFIQDWKELNCGWTTFSKHNNLHVGDVLVFCLIDHFKFKVYIVREKELVGVEEAIDAVSDPNLLGSETDRNVSEEGVGSSGSDADVLKMKSSEDFSIVVNGLTLDSHISEDVRRKYYELCCSQKSILHQHIIEYVDSVGWIEAIICKIVGISDDIRACRASAPPRFYESRITMLESFEKLGMNVGFLLDRLKGLEKMAFTPEVSEVLRRKEKARHELLDVEEKTRALELEVVKLQKRREELVFEIEEKSIITRDHEREFLEMAKAAW